MTTDPISIAFPPFRLEVTTGTLWRGKRQQSLRAQAAMVLQYLAERPGQVVNKHDLLAALWQDTTVSEGVLKTYVWEIRRALGDPLQKPRFIETIPRRGYRFIGSVQSPESKVQSLKSGRQHFQSTIRLPPPSGGNPPAPSVGGQSAISLVGRDTELAQLHRYLDRALMGERQIVFVSGEPGIGKTSLVEAFLQSLASQRVQNPKPVLPAPVPQAQMSLVEGSKVQSQDDQSLDPRRQTLDAGPWIGRGQCIEHYGPGEAYMPVLTALGRLCRESEGKPLLKLLHRYAPTWLVQLPALQSTKVRERLEQETRNATRGRMLREIAEAIETITATRALILWVDDLHWSDTSTLDLLSFLASRHERARLLIVGTYRPVDILGNGHPLRAIVQELTTHKQCSELQVGSLSEADMAEYLGARFAGEVRHGAPLGRLAHAIHQRTEGNPLFMVNAVDYLLAQGAIPQVDGQWDFQRAVEAVQTAVPPSIQQMIERQIEQVSSADQRILEVASAVGAEFSAAAVAAGLEVTIEEVEERCAEFTRRALFLRPAGTAEWPSGTIAARYAFLHALYQRILYERIPTGRRITLHQRIGERLEQGYGTQTREIAAELAVHFERGRDFNRTIRYLRQAGENATRQSAHSEAINLFTKGLALLRTLPHTDERTQQEIRLHLALGLPLTTLKGYASPEVEHAYTRARLLCQQIGETRYLFPAVLGLGGVRQNQAEFRKARVLAQQLLRLARTEGDPARLLWAHVLSGQISYLVGKFALARQDFEEGIALYDERRHSPHASDVVQDPGVHCRCYLAEILWIQGYADQAQQLSHQSLRLARQLTHSYSKAVALSSAVLLHNWVGKRSAARDLAEELIALTHQQGFPFWLAIGTVRQGWTLVAEGQDEQGLAQMRQGLAIFHTTGAKFAIPSFFCDLAEAHEMAGQVEEGLALVTAALKQIAKSGEHLSEAELYRLKGNLLVQKFQVSGSKFQVDNPQSAFSDPQREAEACFLKAITIARKQQAKSLELRAVMSLVRLRQQQVTQSAACDTRHETHHRLLEAYRMLSDLYDWFTEGFETADLKEAKALLSAFQ